MSGDRTENAASQQSTRWIERAQGWLDTLDTPEGLRASSATGNYYTLFGRDSLWCTLLALEASRLLPQDSALAQWVDRLTEHTLRALAATQGAVHDNTNEEQPGKIVHEYWPQMPPHLRTINWPNRDGRYYGSTDATFLYLMAAVATWHHSASGRSLIEELWDSVRAALKWALAEGDVDGDGLIEVLPRQPDGRGLRHQVWKDSTDSVLTESGSVPEAPLAWLELQGYAHAAFCGLRDILRARGEEKALQEKLARQAAQLEGGLNAFWLPGEDCPAMVLTREKQPIPLISSNIGHVLWCEVFGAERAQAAAKRLTRSDMLTRWGLRTLSSESYAFAPLSYHRGSIWPFDNAVAAGGLWRMGQRDRALLIGERVLEALDRLATPVELYCTLPAAWVHAPDMGGQDPLVEYHTASAVQAWSAAAILLFAAQRLAAE